MKEEEKKKSEKKNDKTEIKDNVNRVSVFSLYRFTGTREKILIVLGVIMAVGAGALGPVRTIFNGKAIGGFGSGGDIMDNITTQVLNMIYLGLGMMAASAICEFAWTAVGERLGVRVRTLYLEAVMKKDIAWFDMNRPQELPTRISSLISKYQSGIGEKVGKVVMTITMFLSGLVISMVYGWELALIFVGLAPFTVLAAKFISVANSRGAETSKQAYAKCGGYADEAITAIRTVYAFCTEEFEKSKYLSELSKAQKTTVYNAIFRGLSIGVINFVMAFSHGLGYFVGSFYIQYDVNNSLYDKPYDCSLVMTVFFSALMAMFSLGMIAPQIEHIDQARMSAYDIYEVIDSVAHVDKEEKKRGMLKIPPEKFKGLIEFKNVTFHYPARPDVKVLDNFSMAFEPGKMIGLCGETGSGKSTIIQLIERFYVPSSGVITVDGVDLNTLDLEWWRGMVGYVGQEPVLFNTSIRTNIEYGKEGAPQEEIEEAATQANAIEFIKKLNKGYDTITGSEGSQLSGGQKQRIAIARGLLKKPKILLLDEATSALDGSSERKVQNSFNKLQKEKEMTMIVIAHRLSTIKSADKIIVLHDGVLKEEGTDKELRQMNTIYANLCRLQDIQTEELEDIEMEVLGVPRKRSTSRKMSVHEKEKNEVIEPPKLTKEQEEKKMQYMKAKFSQYRSLLWAENWKYKFPLIMAILLSLLAGFYMPVIGLLFGMVSMDLQNPDMDEMRHYLDLEFMGFLVTGAAMFGMAVGMFGFFGHVASKVTHSLRDKLYQAILKMDIGWFDLPSNIPSNLNTLLSEGTENINGVVRIIAGTILQCLSALVIGLAVGFAYSWKMALIVLACVPVLGISIVIQAKFQTLFAKSNDELYKDSTKILTEAVKNFRTVASFSNQNRILRLYVEALSKPLKNSQSSAVISGVLYGIGQLIPFLIFAGLFYFCALFTKKLSDAKSNFIAVYTLLFSAMIVGQIQQYAPDMGKAYTSLFTIYGIIEQKPKVFSPETPSDNPIKGRIEFKSVSFKYPTREDYVLQDVSLSIEPGQKVAIVGISGSGKSTIVQLLERFYDVDSGEILIDGVNIKNYSTNDLRKVIGYVPQEPVLFDTTIEENVKYGFPDATRNDIEEACKISDAYDFITKDDFQGMEAIMTQKALLDDQIDAGKGFERKVGAKGSMLSGGQKQRIAIARAILRNPKVVLFDEATSALDSETEKVVQKALNQVSVGRTSVVIAHRLGTIGDNDTIFVLENGKVAESGTKTELIGKKGCFYKLYGSTTK